MTALRGVRSSWLTMRRKERVSASARWRRGAGAAGVGAGPVCGQGSGPARAKVASC